MITVANKYYKHLSEFGVDAAIDAGKSWYPDAWRICQRIGAEHGLAARRVAAVMAVTSPRARWSTNLAATAMLCAEHKAGTYSYSYNILGASATKGVRVLESRYYSNVISGPKVSAFYDAICGDTDSVTVDSIMSKAAGYSSDVSDRIREEVVQACWMIGDVFGVSPRDAQAAVWVAYRGGAA